MDVVWIREVMLDNSDTNTPPGSHVGEESLKCWLPLPNKEVLLVLWG